jgi:hypothetical protein
MIWLTSEADHFAVSNHGCLEFLWISHTSSSAQGGFLVVPADSDSSSAWFKIKMSEQRSWTRPRDPATTGPCCHAVSLGDLPTPFLVDSQHDKRWYLWWCRGFQFQDTLANMTGATTNLQPFDTVFLWGRPKDTIGNGELIANRTHESDTSVTFSFPPSLSSPADWSPVSCTKGKGSPPAHLAHKPSICYIYICYDLLLTFYGCIVN